MAGRMDGFRSVWVLDDAIAVVYDFVRHAAGSGTRVVPLSPREVDADLPGRLADGEVDLLLVDAWDVVRQQHDRSQSRLATSLDALELVRQMPPSQRPTVVGYSAMMDRAEVAVPILQAGADAVFVLERLTWSMPQVLGGDFSGRRELTAGDWDSLGLTDRAEVVEAHQLCRRHPRSWEQIWDGEATFDRAAQMFMRRNLLPLLPTPSGEAATYRHVRRVLRTLSCLPVSF